NPASSAAAATAPTAAGGSPLCDAIDKPSGPTELTPHRLSCRFSPAPYPCRNDFCKTDNWPRHRGTPMTMIDVAAVVGQVRQGMIPAHLYGDQEIFALERDRVFSRSWVFLAHESEIPDPGDYVVRRVLNDSFIVARDEAGQVR